jgi:NADPH:quinone reductase-like Zn-dependent oxidoreductase
MDSMKAVRAHEYGGPEVLKYEDAPRPQPNQGEILVRVHGAGVNPLDWKVRAGYMKTFIPHTFPFIPGWDLSGVVESVGAGIDRFKSGDEVYARPDAARDGAYAEYIVVRDSEAALKPKSIDHIHAGGVPLAGLTAWQALFDTGGLTSGQKVLIHGGSGGVGILAVQFAKWKGAHVIATGSKRNQEFLESLGVDEFIDYTATRFENVVHDADLVLDTIGGETQERSWGVLKKAGILVSLVGPPSSEQAAVHGVRGAGLSAQPSSDDLTRIADLIDEGRVKTVVEIVLPLFEARRAQEISEAGHTRGKIVLNVA